MPIASKITVFISFVFQTLYFIYVYIQQRIIKK